MALTLKALRVNKGLTQDQAAEYLDVTPDTLSNWENGRSFPNVPNINKITKLYEVSYDDIIFLPDTSIKLK